MSEEMNYSQFLNMVPEVSLTAVLLVVFIADFCSSKNDARKWFNPWVCLLMAVHTIVNICPTESVEVFGGMYSTGPAAGVLKTVLSLGTLIVIIQAREWLGRKDTAFKEGEFYMLVVSTLLGMNITVSASHFLLLLLGLEMASVPMACLVAFDKYRHNSAEAGAKYILTTIFSSAVMAYGISLLYAACGTMYFDDVAASVTASPLTIAGLVLFFSGLGFKISLVPFHFWTADSYQGAPTSVTGYLSVVSKGAAAFTLCTVLMKVFAPMVEYWTVLLYIVIVLSITVANLFAIRQSDLKRFMAYSSISQAGYIMLAVTGNSTMGVTALTYYMLVYVVANMSVFTIISVVEEHNGGDVQMDSYNGLYTTNPRLAFLMTLALFSLGGIPPFAGMFSKFFVFMAAVQDADIHTTLGAWAYGVVFIALANTVVSLYYYMLIVKAMYIKHNENPLPTFKSAVSTKLALAVCTVGIVLFGICSCVFDWVSVAANA